MTEANPSTAPEPLTPVSGEAPAPAPAPFAAEPVDFKARPFRRPDGILFVPALATFGALLWAYVVLGELVVQARFPEPIALLVVLGTFCASAVFRGRQNLALVPAPSGAEFRRIATPALLALIFFGSAVFLGVLAGGAAGRSNEGFVTFLLLVTGIAAFAVGHRRSGSVNRRLRIVLIPIFAVAGLATLVVLAALLSRFG